VRTLEDLRRDLARIDGRAYPAYKDLRGSYDLGDLTLHVDRVQGDPFAAPSRLRVRVPREHARLPEELMTKASHRIALADFLSRRMRDALSDRAPGRGRRGSGKSGAVSIDAGGQEVLERSALRLDPGFVEARLEVGLPAAGRRILSREAEHLLTEVVPEAARAGLRWKELPQDEARGFVACVENQQSVRSRLGDLGLVAFVADGSLLARVSGASDRPLREGAIPLRAPESLRVQVDVPHGIPAQAGSSTWTGLGIPRGVTLIVGGGYHGKSTLLKALERGVYPHLPGDGRERVVSVADAVKVRAEEGRCVTGVDVHGFISDLPFGRATDCFATADASGSTSQAANIVEAMELEASCLLVDEDTSATNFLIRDARMQSLVAKEREPITPLLDRVRELYERFGLSTVLVMGGCGDYFDVADTVIWMREYQPHDATHEAGAVARAHPSGRRTEAETPLAPVAPRTPLADSLDPSQGRRDVKISARGLDEIVFGTETIDLRAVEQLVDPSQTRAVGHALELARTRLMNGKRTLGEVVRALDEILDADGLDGLEPFHRRDTHPGNYARPRGLEIAAALNRLRSLRVE
jgi:predicted ABC-class ATPase